MLNPLTEWKERRARGLERSRNDENPRRMREELPIRAFQRGDQNAFSLIYGRFKLPILSYVSARIPNPGDQDEITQEIFLKAFRFRESYDPRYEFSTWLWTIARNTVSDWLRRHRPAGAPDFHDSDEPTQAEELPSELHDAEEIVLRKFERRHLVRTLRHLTRLQRRVLWLRIIHQHSYAEIGKKLGLSLSAVKNLSMRAKTRLTSVLGVRPRFA